MTFLAVVAVVTNDLILESFPKSMQHLRRKILELKLMYRKSLLVTTLNYMLLRPASKTLRSSSGMMASFGLNEFG